MSPYFQQTFGSAPTQVVPLSTTKFLNGHSDGLGGVGVVVAPSGPGDKLVAFRARKALPGSDFLSTFECLAAGWS